METIHGKMEFATHFGRLYVLNIPKSFTEDSEPPSVGNFQTNLSRGYKPRPSVLSVPRDIRKYGKTRRSKSKGKDFEIGKAGKKIPKEKASRSSFFTLVSSQEKAVHFLTQKGFSEAQSSEFYSVEIHTDHEFDVVTDKDFNFQKIKFPKLRWCAVDIKRAWKENPEKQDDTELDGVETDVRFILQVGRLKINTIEEFSNGCTKTDTKVITQTNHNISKQRDEPITVSGNCLSLAPFAGKIARSRCDWFWFCFCFSLVEK